MSAYGEGSDGMFKAAEEACEASRSGDGDVVVLPGESEGKGMPVVDKEKATFDGNLL
jgi:hypothetical protein